MSLYHGYEIAHGCTGGPRPGAKALMAWFLGAYQSRGGRNGGIYACKRLGSGWSIHAEGRACDLMIPAGASWGQPLADALVNNSRELGIQCVIYRRHEWSGSYPDAGWRPYDGDNPHNDHIHAELSTAAAANLTVPVIVKMLAPGSATGSTPLVDVAGRMPVLNRGDADPVIDSWYVTRAQVLLGNLLGRALDADGEYGPVTAQAVKDYNAKYLGRTTDGGTVDGPMWHRMFGLR